MGLLQLNAVSFSISHSRAPSVLNGVLINATRYALVSNVKALLIQEEVTEKERKVSSYIPHWRTPRPVSLTSLYFLRFELSFILKFELNRFLKSCSKCEFYKLNSFLRTWKCLRLVATCATRVTPPCCTPRGCGRSSAPQTRSFRWRSFGGWHWRRGDAPLSWRQEPTASFKYVGCGTNTFQSAYVCVY